MSAVSATVALLILGWGALFVMDARAIQASAAEGRSDLGLAVTALARGEASLAIDGLAGARAAVDDASARADGPAVRLAQFVPFLGREVRVTRQAVAAASEITSAVEAVGVYLSIPHDPMFDSGAFDPVATEKLAGAWAQAEMLMASAADRMQGTAPARTTAVSEAAADVALRANQGKVATTAVGSLLDAMLEGANGGDPFNALVVLTNGAELRGLNGTPAFLIRVEVADGGVRVSEVRPTGADPAPAGIAMPAEFENLFGDAARELWWANLTLTPDGPTVGELATTTVELEGSAPDVVVVADLVATGALLAAFPNLEIDGEPLRAGTIATDFLFESYATYPAAADQNRYLAGVFSTMFEHVLTTPPPANHLLQEAQRAITQRRLTLWSRHPDIQAAVVQLGAAHPVAPSAPGTVEIAVQNLERSKLDMYTRFDAAIRIETELSTCLAYGRLDLAVIEEAPPRRLPILAHGSDANRWLVNAYLPSGATEPSIHVDGEPAAPALGTWGDRPVVSAPAQAAHGDRVGLVIEWVQPIPPSRVVTVKLPTTVQTAQWQVQAEVPVPEGCTSTSS